jgi:hypothetical protein
VAAHEFAARESRRPAPTLGVIEVLVPATTTHFPAAGLFVAKLNFVKIIMQLFRSSFVSPLSLASALALTFVGGCVQAAPKANTSTKTPATPAAKAAPTSTSATGAIVINATTRNDTVSRSTLALAQNGKALLPVVISAKASDATKAVANDMADILKRITGAEFEIKTGDGQSGIVLGTLAEFPDPELNEALKIYNSFDGKEAYAIRTEPKRLLLIGATDLGASHAAYRFLHAIGYRSFFPDAAWEVVPNTPDLKFARDITDRPQILSRDIWFEAGSGPGNADQDYATWKRRNNHAQSFVVNAGHNLFVIPGAFPEEFKAHPEYYAQTADGKLITDDIELTNPAVRQLVVEYARRFFKANPNADMVSIDPTDRPTHSQSPEALKSSYSDQIFGLANEVAKMLQKEFPGKMVGLYSYSGHWDPPSFKLEPNVHVLMASLGQGKYTGAERAKIWPERSSNRGVYEYYGVFLWQYDKLPGSMGNLHDLQQKMQQYARTGVTSISAESTSNWGPNGRAYYTANALMWNPYLDLDAFLDDFYTKAFGPGAPAMKRYYERLANARFLSRQLIGQAFRDVDEATKLAKDRPDVQARLDFIKLYLRYGQLEWEQSRDGVKDLGEEIATLYVRTNTRAILTWQMARQTWWGGKQWNWSDPKYQPFTHEEIERNFQEGLTYFPVNNDIGTPVTYSDHLVPIDWTPEQKGNAKLIFLKDKDGQDLQPFQNYQGGVRYALYSLHGEPLKFTTGAGDAWGGINRLTISDAKGNGIFEEKNIPNNKATIHNIAVPGPGLYWLDYNDNGSYWAMYTPEGLIATIPLGQTQDYRNMVYIPPQMFFYVPKGIKSIEYFYTRTAFHPGGPHQVVNPNGEVVKDVDINGDWISIPVPTGMDGKLWSFRNPVLGIFWFNNLPNYFAPTPDGLMVPREVAEKDGLTIRR